MGDHHPSPTTSNLPLYRLAWQRIRQQPLPYLLCIFGIALGVAMMVSIDLANGSAQRAFSLSTDAITGRATHRIVAVAPQGIAESVYGQLKRAIPDLVAAPVVEGYVKVEELGAQPMHLLGVDLFAESPFRNYFQVDKVTSQGGDFSQFLTSPDALVLSQETSEAYHLALNQPLHLDVAGQPHTARLAGTLATTDTLNRRALGNFLFADIATAQELLAQGPYLSHIDIIAQQPQQLAAIQALLPTDLKLETAAAQKNAVQQMTAAFELNLTALSLLALVVGMFLIYNTVTFSVVQRRAMFGVLRCLGATQGQLLVLILGEAAIFSIIGSALGVGLGIVLGRSIVGLITQTINDFYFVVTVQQITLAQTTLVKGVVIGIAASLFAAALPALEAANTPPTLTLQRSTLERRGLGFCCYSNLV
jgi:putative ABC transport system permease protein